VSRNGIWDSRWTVCLALTPDRSGLAEYDAQASSWPVLTPPEVIAMTTAPNDTSPDDQLVQLDDEAKQLKLQQVKAESRKAIAEAEKSRLSALLPTADVKPTGTKTEVGSNVGLAADLLSHKLVDVGAGKLVADIQTAVAGGKILIVDDIAFIATDWPYSFISAELSNQTTALTTAVDTLKSHLIGSVPLEREAPREEEVVEEEFALPALAIPAAVAVAPSVVAGVASLVSLFRSDYAISSRDVKIGVQPLLAAVVRHLTKVTPKIAVTVDRFRILGPSTLITAYENACMLRAELGSLRDYAYESSVLVVDKQIEDIRLEIKMLGDQLTATKETSARVHLDKRLTELRDQIRQLEKGSVTERSLVRTADAIGSRFDVFSSSVTATPTGALYPPLVAAAMREQLHTNDGGYSHILFVGLEATGGEVVSERAPFWKGNHLDYLGGCAVFYLLHSVPENSTVAAGSHQLMSRLRYDLGSSESKGVKEVTL
jgi:hypothetical protein